MLVFCNLLRFVFNQKSIGYRCISRISSTGPVTLASIDMRKDNFRSRKKGLLLRLKLLSPFLFAFLTGCTSMEHVLDMPLSQNRTVNDYKVAPHDVSVHLFDPVGVNETVAQKLLKQRIQNLYVLIVPGAESDTYRGYPTKVYGREIYRRFNRTLPHIPLHGGAWELRESSETIALGGYLSTRIEKNLDLGEPLPSIGTANLALAIDEIARLSMANKGSTALIVFGDLRSTQKDIEEAVLRFRQQGDFNAGFQVLPEMNSWSSNSSMNCFYAVNLTASYSASLIDDVDSCGFSVAADKIAQPSDMAHFVERIFFTSPRDSDGDGIYDYLDQCPEEGRDRIVDKRGCLRFKEGQ